MNTNATVNHVRGISNFFQGNLVVGHNAGSTGWYNLKTQPNPTTGSDAKLWTVAEVIGNQGTGIFLQDDATDHNIHQSLTLGSLPTGTGNYTIESGTLAVGTDEIIGGFGSGNFVQKQRDSYPGPPNHQAYDCRIAHPGEKRSESWSLQPDGRHPHCGLCRHRSQRERDFHRRRGFLDSPQYTLGAGAKLNLESIGKGAGVSVFNLNSDGLKFTKPSVATIIDVGTVSIGSAAGTQGSFSLSSGTQQLKAGTFNVGYDGNGTFSQSASTQRERVNRLIHSH